MADNLETSGLNSTLEIANGASLDEAKMAGTKASKAGSSTLPGTTNYLGVKGNMQHTVPSLEKAEKKVEEIKTSKKFDTTQFNKEQAVQSFRQNQSLNNLGNIGKAVQDSITAKIANLYDASATEDVSQGVGVLADMEGTDPVLAELATTFNTVNETTANMPPAEAASAMNKAIGEWAVKNNYTGPDGKISIPWATIQAILPPMESSVGHLVAKGLADTVTVNSDMLQGLGYTEAEIGELSTRLGLTGNESIEQFREAVRKYTDTEGYEVRSLESRLRDPATTMAEKREILGTLREMGYTGGLASEAQIASINEAVQSSEEGIELFGKTYDSVAEALDDDNVSFAIAQYLRGDTSVELPEGLKSIVDQNKEGFEALVEEMQDDFDKFGEVQTEVSKLTDPEVADTVDFFEVEGFDPDAAYYTEVPKVEGALASAINGDEEAKQVLGYVADNLPPSTSKTVKNAVNSLGPKDISTLSKSPDKMETYVENLEVYDKMLGLSKLSDKELNAMSEDQILNSIFASEDNPQQFSDLDDIWDMANEFIDMSPELADAAGVGEMVDLMQDLFGGKGLTSNLKALMKGYKPGDIKNTILSDLANTLRDVQEKASTSMTGFKNYQKAVDTGSSKGIADSIVKMAGKDPKATMAIYNYFTSNNNRDTNTVLDVTRQIVDSMVPAKNREIGSPQYFDSVNTLTSLLNDAKGPGKKALNTYLQSTISDSMLKHQGKASASGEYELRQFDKYAKKVKLSHVPDSLTSMFNKDGSLKSIFEKDGSISPTAHSFSKALASFMESRKLSGKSTWDEKSMRQFADFISVYEWDLPIAKGSKTGAAVAKENKTSTRKDSQSTKQTTKQARDRSSAQRLANQSRTYKGGRDA